MSRYIDRYLANDSVNFRPGFFGLDIYISISGIITLIYYC